MLKKSLLAKTKNYIVAVSGGPDSMFLLANLVQLGYKNIIPTLINYNIRKDSYNDQIIFTDYCKKHSLNYKIKEINKDYYNLKKNENFESLARKIRYDYFYELALKFHAEILIAHNVTDNIETYLLQKKRNNLVLKWGLAEKTFYGSLKIPVIRPILEITREQIIKYLHENKIKYYLDYTNDLLIYERNKIRKLLIKENNFAKYLALIKSANKDLELIQESVNKNYSEIVFNNKINLPLFYLRTPIEQQRILHMYFCKQDMQYLIINRKKSIIKEVIKQLHSKKPNIFVYLNNDVIFVKEYKTAFIHFKKNNTFKTININVIINNKWDGIGINFFINNDSISINSLPGYYFYFNKADLPIKISNDKEVLKKAHIGTLPLNKFFIKNKVPLLKRNLPVVIDKWNNVLAIVKFKTIIFNQNKKYIALVTKTD